MLVFSEPLVASADWGHAKWRYRGLDQQAPNEIALHRCRRWRRVVVRLRHGPGSGQFPTVPNVPALPCSHGQSMPRADGEPLLTSTAAHPSRSAVIDYSQARASALRQIEYELLIVWHTMKRFSISRALPTLDEQSEHFLWPGCFVLPLVSFVTVFRIARRRPGSCAGREYWR